jgi:membrane protein YdbS with pleckstrin-like domain
MDIYNQTDKQLEDRLQKHKRTMRLMLIVFVVVIALNVLFTNWMMVTEPLSELLQIVVALPICIINVLSIWWLVLGGKWR